jgi:hypothetical protein
LEEIEKRSQALLEKAKAPRFVDKAVLFIDKGRDSGEVVKLVEQLRDAITGYQVSEDWFVASNTTYTAGQVSQQQAIYDQITNLTVRVFRPGFHTLYTDDRSRHRVFFQHPLEAPRGDADRWACPDIG